MKIKIFLLLVMILLVPTVAALHSDEFMFNKLVLYDKFEDASLTVDSSNEALTGSLRSTPTHKTSGCQVGSGCATFDGADDVVQFTAGPTPNFTISVWLKTTGDNDHMYFAGQNPDYSSGTWQARLGNDEQTVYWTYRADTELEISHDWGSSALKDDAWWHFCGVVNSTGSNVYNFFSINGTLVSSDTKSSGEYTTPYNITIGMPQSQWGGGVRGWPGDIDEFMKFNYSADSDDCNRLYELGRDGLELASESDSTPPHITKYSDQGASCSNWNTNPSNPCSTGDTTPTLYFNTSENAYCAIGVSDLNYTTMGSSRNCTSGEGTTEHACTLTLQDELVYEDSIVYLSCKDTSGNENITSTSGPLSLTLTGLESGSESSIEIGIQNALLTDYTIYSDQQIYARKLDGTQDTGTFDRVAKKGSKTWAFNYITKGEEHVGLFNLTPVLYVLEMANSTNSTIINLVELMINETK